MKLDIYCKYSKWITISWFKDLKVNRTRSGPTEGRSKEPVQKACLMKIPILSFFDQNSQVVQKWMMHGSACTHAVIWNMKVRWTRIEGKGDLDKTENGTSNKLPWRKKFGRRSCKDESHSGTEIENVHKCDFLQNHLLCQVWEQIFTNTQISTWEHELIKISGLSPQLFGRRKPQENDTHSFFDLNSEVMQAAGLSKRYQT